MSTYWYPYCRTCDTDEGQVLWWNHGDGGVREFIRLMPALKVFVEALETAGARSKLDIHIDFRGPERSDGALEFATKHAGHDVAARNEYGAFDDRCGEWSTCPCCNHQQICQLEQGHNGDHSPRGRAPNG